MESPTILLTSFAYPTEAYPLLGRLDSAGIAYTICNETALPFTEIIKNSVSRLEVYVSQHDMPDALAILDEMKLEKQAAEQAMGAAFEKVSAFCPECDSNEVFRKKSGFSWFSREHRCLECGHIWKQ